MEETEQHVHRICDLDLQDDLEMISHTAMQHQCPDPPDGSPTGMKRIVLFRGILKMHWNFESCNIPTLRTVIRSDILGTDGT